MIHFDRFDICVAYYIFAIRYHSGQWSYGYRKLSQLSRMRFKPSLSVQNCKFENYNQKLVYRKLVAEKRNVA